VPSNEERRQAAREKLAKQNERREADARKRKVKAIVISTAVVAVVAAAACYIWVPAGPRAPLRVAAENRYKSQHVSCTFGDVDLVAKAKQNVEQQRKQPDEYAAQIESAKKQLATLPAEQRKLLEDQIPQAERDVVAMRQAIPEYEKQVGTVQALVDGRNKSVQKPSGTDVPNTGTEKGTITTNQGAIGFELDRSKAPCNVETFTTLIQAKYFDNTSCHRETAQPGIKAGAAGLFVLQCGDPSATGLGGPSWSSPDETPTFLKADPNGGQDAMGSAPKVLFPAGTIAVAKGGPNSGGSQFFIVYKETSLPADYSVIGKVDDAGLTTVQAIAAKGIAPGLGKAAPAPGKPVTDGKPAQPVNITTMALAS
jgi:peptidyl-prolyl cis-trans isomerase B (cyclophilin B)